jgi:hypothetical protein
MTPYIDLMFLVFNIGTLGVMGKTAVCFAPVVGMRGTPFEYLIRIR